jgi:hypothetical protein
MKKVKLRRSEINWHITIAGLFGLMGGACLLGFGPERITCDRLNAPQVNCQIRKYALLGLQQVESQDLPNVKHVKLDTKTKTTTIDSDDGSTSGEIHETNAYGVILINDREHLFNGYSKDLSSQQKVIDQLTTFLNNPTAKHVSMENQNIPAGVLGLICLMISAGVLAAPFMPRSQN